MKILPAILTGDAAVVQHQIELVEQNMPEVERVQIDVVDGNFAPEMTVTPSDLVAIDWHDLEIDFHLMADEPLDFFREAVEAGAELPVAGMIAQIEHTSDVGLFLEEVRRQGWRGGISLDLYTPVEEIDWQWLDFGLETIQLMAVEAGEQGQEFNKLVLEKVRAVRAELDKRGIDEDQVEIWVDGGVKPELVEAIQDAGADGVAVGSALWQELGDKG